ncbi:MAG: UDP-N-acetylmuramate--L-alanine ligase [Eubacteriales bacterium]
MALSNTHFGADYINGLLNGPKHIFFDGIGGISMNSLAHITHLMGHRVSGYDRSPSDITHKLESMGISVYYEADAAHLADCDLLVYTVAMPEDNPEYVYAGEHGIPRVSRADFLGYLMTGFRNRVGVSGTHGKSTTTGMLARILSYAGADPTVFNGAAMKETGTVDRIGGREHFVFEACEYMDSFLDFNPSAAIVLNVEMDHLDYFHSIEQMIGSYQKFIGLTGENGCAILNWNDENCRKAADGYNGHLITFGRNHSEADYSSVNEGECGGYPVFDLLEKGERAAHVALKIPGEHNIADALAAFAAARYLGIPAQTAAEGLSAYEGICRRMEKITVTGRGAVLYTDYAHHPTEIEATLRGARKICPRKLNLIFQPHTFSRTAELFDDFAAVFSRCGANEIVLCDIYPARETNIYGVSSAQLAEKIAGAGKKCRVFALPEEAAEYVDAISGEGDMILVMGAGDVIRAADMLEEKYK